MKFGTATILTVASALWSYVAAAPMPVSAPLPAPESAAVLEKKDAAPKDIVVLTAPVALPERRDAEAEAAPEPESEPELIFVEEASALPALDPREYA